MVRLPAPAGEADPALTGLLRLRRSTKAIAADPLDLATVAGLLWCATGSTDGGRRTHGSAHAAYPVATTLVAGAVHDLETGGYRYVAEEHRLAPTRPGDRREELATATLDAAWLARAPAVVVLSADLGGVVPRFTWIEVGLTSQNLHLAAAARGLGTVLIGGLDPGRAAAAGEGLIPDRHQILALLPVGRPAD